MKKAIYLAFLAAALSAFAQDNAQHPLTDVTLEYDAAHRLAADNGPDGHKTAFSYDRAGRPVALVTDGRTDAIEYDGVGNVAALTDNTGKTAFTYTPWRNLKSMRYPAGDTIAYEYDSRGLILRVTWQTVGALQYNRDLLGRVIALQTPAGAVVFQYDDDTRTLRRQFPNGASSVFTYNEAGRPLSIRHAGADKKPFLEFTYTYDDAGRLAGSVEKSKTASVTVAYAYDRYGELTGADYSDGRRYRYEYDASGNLVLSTDGTTKESAAFDERDRLKTLNGDQATHDGFGNLVSVGTRTFAFDARGRLLADGNGRYEYDALGLRVSAASGKNERRFVHLLADRAYLLGESGAGKLLYLLCDGRALGQIVNGRALFFFEDQLGSVRAAMDASGKIAGSADFTPFGRPLSRIPGVALGFAGEEQAADGVVFLRARSYVPEARGRIEAKHVCLRGK
jgi:YD repeat-containing protein